MRTAEGLASEEIQIEFKRQAQSAVNLLRAAFSFDLPHVCSESQDHLESDIDMFTTVEGYHRFWCVCAANAQGVTRTAPYASIIHDVVSRQGTEPKYSIFGNIQQVITALPPSAFKSSNGSALFPIISRFNHSCRPNVMLREVPRCSRTGDVGEIQFHGVEMCAYATRDIEMGEELCISYLDDLGGDGCAELMERYGFSCECANPTGATL
jgi:hypothetical protein